MDEEDVRFEQFEEVPEDIQNAILTSSPRERLNTSTLSKTWREKAISAIQQNILDPPDNDDIIQYLLIVPEAFLILDYGWNDRGLFEGFIIVFYGDDEDSNEFCCESAVIYKRENGTLKLLTIETDHLVTPPNIDDILIAINSSIHGNQLFDLKLISWLIEKRSRIIQISTERRKHFIIESTLKYLNKVKSIFQHDLLPYFYEYLYYNAIIFNVELDDEMIKFANVRDVTFLHNETDFNTRKVKSMANILYLRIVNAIIDNIDLKQ